MAKGLVPFWEEAYQNKDATAFSSKPNVTIKEFEQLFCKHSHVLDVGCGEGQNALYLAQQGHYVEDEHPNVPKHLHASNKIVVRKVK